MDFQTLASSGSLSKIKCTSCKNYLSYFPITISREEVLCGRCPSTDITIRNVSFEALAQFIKFPCRYESQGCFEELLPKDIPDHEKMCKYQPSLCLLNEAVACEWQGPQIESLQHCLELHSDLVLKNQEFEFDITKSENVRNIVVYGEIPIFFDRKFDSEKKKLHVVLSTSLNGPQLNILCWLEMKCKEKRFAAKLAWYSEKKYLLTELDLTSVTYDCDTVIGKLVFRESDQNGTADVEILSVLKCVQCSEYAVPPIYRHCFKKPDIVCSYCKNIAHSTCRNSECKGINNKEDNLTKIAQLLNYPCKYSNNGCTFVAKPEKIIEHQGVCKMQRFMCPLAQYISCSWNGTLKQVIDHSINNHSHTTSGFISNGSKISIKYETGLEYYSIIKFSNRMFLLSAKKSKESKNNNNCYYFTVQVVGPCTDNFLFEIQIEEASKKGMRLLARKSCNRVTTLEQRFENFDYYCYFEEDQISGFVPNGVINYSVHIFKNV